MKRLHLGKILLVICCVFTLLVLSSSCLMNHAMDWVVGVTQACYAIPGGYVSDMYASGADLIEKDEYGRWLMAVWTGSGYSLSALCIAQRVDAEYVYYYDNVNYVCTEEYNEYELYQVDALKVVNDWGQPLDETKMVKRELNDKSDLIPAMHYMNIRNLESSERIFEENICIPTEYHYSITICDWDASGKEIYLASTFTMEDTKRIWHKHYLMVINADGTYDSENFMVEFDDLAKSNQPLTEVKEKNDWQGKTGPMS